MSEEITQALDAQRQAMQVDREAAIRQAKAEAWEEGYRAGYDHGDMHFAPPNPYRGGQ